MKCNKCGTEFDGTFCPNCDTPATFTVSSDQKPKEKKPLYKKWWFWVLLVLIVGGVIGWLLSPADEDVPENNPGSSVSEENPENQPGNSAGEEENQKPDVTIIDFSSMTKEEIAAWAAEHKITCKVTAEYSDTVAEGSLISQSKKADETVKEGDTIELAFSIGKKPPVEYMNALKKAESYSKNMNMSKNSIYHQLTSEYGENFSEDAAQFAIENLQADYKANALAKAESYSSNLHMSKQKIYKQLISEYGEKFTEEEAQYAIDTLQADYKANALEKAKSYRDTMNMSKDRIYKQLISEHGEYFTEEEAQFAVDQLED